MAWIVRLRFVPTVHFCRIFLGQKIGKFKFVIYAKYRCICLHNEINV